MKKNVENVNILDCYGTNSGGKNILYNSIKYLFREKALILCFDNVEINIPKFYNFATQTRYTKARF